MILTNYSSGELEISGDGHSIRLPRDQANRLILAARMHSVTEFLEKIPALIPQMEITQALQKLFEAAHSSTDRWNLKEKFARLQTLTKDYTPKNPDAIAEKIDF